MLARQSPLNSADRELDRFRFRVALAGIVVVVALALLIARLVHLQVVQHDYYTTRAEDNRISLVPIVPNRGVIVDRHGTVLARNYSAFTLEITPSKVDDLDATIEGLGKLIEVLPKDRKRFRKLLEESKTFESLPIRTRLTEEEVARFAANRYLFPGVEVKARLFRQYPLGPIASHAIGYISRINKRDLEVIEEEGEGVAAAQTNAPEETLPTATVANQTQTPPEADVAQVVEKLDVVISFTGPTSVDIRDSTMNYGLIGEMDQGDQHLLGGKPPYSLIIGNAAATRIQVGGQPFDFQSVVRGNVARFILDPAPKP